MYACKVFLARRLRDFGQDCSGSYIILAALFMPILLAMGAGSVDVMGVFNAQRELQYIADSAAYTAINNADKVSPKKGATAYVNDVTKSANWRSNHPLLKIDNTQVVYDGKTSTVVVKILAKKKTPFLSMLRILHMPFEVTSSAKGECKPYKATYLGNAFINSENEYVITPDKFFQRGWVWVNNRFDLSQRQDIKLRLYFGNRDVGGADGMAFSIQNDLQGHRAQGQVGESLGVAWHPSYAKNENTIVAPALVVEFDTYRNTFDPYQDHTSVFLLGNKQHEYNNDNAYVDHRRRNEIGNLNKLPNIENGQFHFARFIWDPSKKKLLYFLDGEKIKEIKIDLIDFLGRKDAILGFSGSTGGARNEHKACFFKTTVTS